MTRRWALALFAAFLLLSCACQVAGRHDVLKSSKHIKHSSTKSIVKTKNNMTSKFCKKFISKCYQVALAGKTGHVQVVHQCRRNGGKRSKSYTFGCKADKVDKTAKVLKSLGNKEVKTIIPITATAAATQSFQTLTITTAIATETLTTNVEEIITTAVFGNENEAVQVLQVALSPSVSKRSKHVVTNQFCTTFISGCKSQCVAVKSKSKRVLCKSTSVNNYSLNCQCANGKLETQHALYAAANQASKEIATISSTTSTISQDFATVAAALPTRFVTEKATTTIVEATTATSTTQIILAATGAVEMMTSNESNLGYVYTPDKASAIKYMAVQDSSSGLYQLVTTDGTGRAFIVESGNSGDDYSSNTGAYSWTYSGNPSVCGTAGSTAGPAAGAGSYNSNPCETFVFGMNIDSETLTNQQTVNLTMQWFNPSDFFPNQYSWIAIDTYNYLISAANPVVFSQEYITEQLVSIRFPA